MLLGRKDLIDAALYNTNPWEGAVCRPMKVGKEEIMGILAAIEYWSRADLGVLTKEWQSRVERIQKLVDTVPGVTTNIMTPDGREQLPNTIGDVGRSEVWLDSGSMCPAVTDW